MEIAKINDNINKFDNGTLHELIVNGLILGGTAI